MINANCKPDSVLFIVLFAAILSAGPAGAADYFPFRVAFEDVPGVSEITAGNISKGIAILEQELERGDADKGYVLATMCGAYILESSLEKAAQVCTNAVETFPGATAFNNRGVLRAFTGDFEGASEDFDRARPTRLDEYLEYLKTRDVGLIADNNRDLLDKLTATHSPLTVQTSAAMAGGADIEKIAH